MKIPGSILPLMVLCVFILGGCDKASEPVPKASGQAQSAASQESREADEARQTLDWLLDDQEQLAEQFAAARHGGDLAAAKSLFTEFEKIEADFNSQFEALEGRLSPGTATELSRRHRDIVRKLN